MTDEAKREVAVSAINRWRDACEAAAKALAEQWHPGVQLIARAYADQTCMQAAEAIVDYGGPIELDGIVYHGEIEGMAGIRMRKAGELN
jgi:hypothetical protein